MSFYGRFKVNMCELYNFISLWKKVLPVLLIISMIYCWENALKHGKENAENKLGEGNRNLKLIEECVKYKVFTSSVIEWQKRCEIKDVFIA